MGMTFASAGRSGQLTIERVNPLDYGDSLKSLFAANELSLVRERHEEERRDLSTYLDLAGCGGERRVHAEALAEVDTRVLATSVGWYLLARS